MTPIEVPETFPGVAEAIREAEHFWRECVRAYNDPESFRVNLNALIQAVRNITFRVQSGKSSINDFDEWYVPWQKFLQSEPLMRWVNDARIAVVKKAGLDARSTATVRLIYSYGEALERTIKDLPAALPNEELASALASTVPLELLGNSAIEIERRWEVDELPDVELLDALGEAVRILLGLVSDLDAYMRTGVLTPPEEVIASTAIPPSLLRTRDSRRLRINPQTGVELQHGELFVPNDESLTEAVKRRYKLPVGLNPDKDDPLEVARALFSVAATILKRDGYHAPMLFLHHQDGGWRMRQIVVEDKVDKFLMWRRIAEDVEDHGYDGAIFISEAWAADAESVVGPYATLENVPGRTEHLNVSVATKDGRRLIIDAEFHRRLGRIHLVDPPSEGQPAAIWFLSPLERVWQEGRS